MSILRLNKKQLSPRLLTALRLCIALLAVGFLVYGMRRGEVALVLKKAVRICMECIGLG
jgi:hypothetical protein